MFNRKLTVSFALIAALALILVSVFSAFSASEASAASLPKLSKTKEYKALSSYVSKLKGLKDKKVSKSERKSYSESLRKKASAADELVNERLAKRDADSKARNDAQRAKELAAVADDNADAVEEINDYWDDEVEYVRGKYVDDFADVRQNAREREKHLKDRLKAAKKAGKHSKVKKYEKKIKASKERAKKQLERVKRAMLEEIADVNEDRQDDLEDQAEIYAADREAVNQEYNEKWRQLHNANVQKKKSESGQVSSLKSSGLDYISEMPSK